MSDTNTARVPAENSQVFEFVLTFEMKATSMARKIDAEDLADYLRDKGVSFVLTGAKAEHQFDVGFSLKANCFNDAMVQAISTVTETVPNIGIVNAVG